MSISEIKANFTRGKDYYDRIKELIDRVLEGQNDEEKRIAELFKEKYPIEEKKDMFSQQESGESRPRRAAASTKRSHYVSMSPDDMKAKKRGRPAALGTISLDLSWKDGGTTYPKQSSRIGDEYQATNIPVARTSVYGSHSDL